MKVIYTAILLVLALHLSWSQKILSKVLEDPSLTQIHVLAQEVNTLHLKPSSSKELLVSARLNGEYSLHQMIVFTRKGNTLFIEPDLSATFELPNDKLSAHKIWSVDLAIEIPAYLEVYIDGGNTQINAEGIFEKLQIQLNDGLCVLKEVGNQVRVNTIRAPIILKQKKAIVNAETTYGTLILPSVPKGLSEIVLRSIHGDIKVVPLD
ncbi:MAG: hypothetical protein QNL89_02895 [Flavobacteriaceae bacterium]